MSKVSRLTPLILILWFISLFLPKTTLAYSCDRQIYETSDLTKTITPNQSMGDLTIIITSRDLPAGTYNASFVLPNNFSYDFNVNGYKPLINYTIAPGADIGTGEFKMFRLGNWSIGPYKLLIAEQSKGSKVDEGNADCIFNPVFKIEETLQPCRAFTIPSTIYPNTTGVVLQVEGVTPKEYEISVKSDKIEEIKWVNQLPTTGIVINRIQNNNPVGFPVGDYTVTIKKNNLLQCNPITFKVLPLGTTPAPQPSGTPKACDIYVSPLPESPDKYAVGAGLKDLLPNQDFDVQLTGGGREITKPARSNVNGAFTVNLGNDLTKGDYTIKISDKDSPLCIKDFSIPKDISYKSGKKCTDKDPAGNPISSFTDEKGKIITCSLSGKDTSCGDDEHPAIKTAIGCIRTNPSEFVRDIMTFIIGISGGLAFLMMLLGAFQMLTSAGNPDTLHAGRERLTSAVIGLLIVIFAILLLQIIGVGILNLPGFGK